MGEVCHIYDARFGLQITEPTEAVKDLDLRCYGSLLVHSLDVAFKMAALLT